MICKKITIELIDGRTEEFEDIEWNNSDFGVSLSKKDEMLRVYFYPLNNILKVKAVAELIT